MSRNEPHSTPDASKSTLAEERERLVRLCGYLTGDSVIAEDLAQETLLEAHRNADKLRNPAARQAWLSGIARNVCRRWARARGRELSITASQPEDCNMSSAAWLTDDFDLELELERAELATLLDRALALLPDETRLALIQRYVEDAPQALVAERLGLSQGAVAMRLARGKLALRRVLATELRDDAVEMGLSPNAVERWKPTRMWCTMCGVERLSGHFDPLTGELMLRCPGCYLRYGLYHTRSEGGLELFGGVLGVKAASRRVTEANANFYNQALANGSVRCSNCGGTATTHCHLPDFVPPRIRESRGAHARCRDCDTVVYSSLSGLVQGLQEVRKFIDEHSQVRSLPEQEIVVDGRNALLSRLESIAGAATFDVVTDEATLMPLAMYKNGTPLAKA